jgi:hypothetical protein
MHQVEGFGLGDAYRLQVPGGWIYHIDGSAVFVPDLNAGRVNRASVVTQANEVEGTLYGSELLLSIASVMENAGTHITMTTKRREAVAWACRIAAAHIPELVKAAETDA